MYIMSKDKDKEAPETSNSKESATPPSKASSEEEGELTMRKRAEEREVVVVKPSKTEYKESNITDNSSSSEGEGDKHEEQEGEGDKQEEQEGEGEQSVSAAAKAKESGQSFKEMIKSVGKKAMTKTEEKTKELKNKSAAETVGPGQQKDARDIQALGTHAEDVVLVFEKTMAEIQREDYESQEKLLAGYKKLLEEQINVIDSKQKIAKRLKGISK
jgi:hypothetical protein